MTVEVKPLAEITHEAITILCERIGVANTMRFINQFTTGYGNYTEERKQIFANMTLEDIVSEIEHNKKADAQLHAVPSESCSREEEVEKLARPDKRVKRTRNLRRR